MQRTGTSWIETMLDSHPDVECLSEIFYFTAGRFPFRKKRGLKTEKSYRLHYEASNNRKIKHFLSRRDAVWDYLSWIYDESNYRAIGFKLMYGQSKRFPAVLKYAKENNVRIVHIVRKNIFKTLISWESAKQRKLYHKLNDDIKIRKINLPVRFLLWRLRKIDRQNEYWRSFFSSSWNYHMIEYESMRQNRMEEQEKLLSFLGVPNSSSLTSPLKKINPEALEDVLHNFQDVERILINSPYSWCLE